MIAALYVELGGVYYGLPDVDPWDEERDARLYTGSWPVVAHPPCSSWCQLASVNEARWGSRIGDDDGCFEAALAAVQRCNGVLEHPAYSLAWDYFGLTKPKSRGGWTVSLTDAGATIEVSQVAYGHPARKRTWLYASGVELVRLHDAEPKAFGVVGAGIRSGQSAGRPKISGELRTPLAFRDVLLTMARSALPSQGGPFPEPERLTTRQAGRDGC